MEDALAKVFFYIFHCTGGAGMGRGCNLLDVCETTGKLKGNCIKCNGNIVKRTLRGPTGDWKGGGGQRFLRQDGAGPKHFLGILT